MTAHGFQDSLRKEQATRQQRKESTREHTKYFKGSVN